MGRISLGVYLKSYEEFKESAIRLYNSLPYEANELYKRHFLSVNIPEISIKDKYTSARDEVDKFAKEISDKIKINFDIVISNNLIKNKLKNVNVKKMTDIPLEQLENKLYKNEDNKFAAFVNAFAEDFVVIDIKEGANEKVKMLVISESIFPIQIMINAADSSRLEVFELFVSKADSETIVAPLHEIKAGRGSQVELNVLHNENDKTTVINLCKGEAMENSFIKTNFIYNGAKMTKGVGLFEANGKDAKVKVNEIVYGAVDQKFDLNTYILNAKEKTTATLNSGAVLDGSAFCIMKGYAKVDKWSKGAKSNIAERGILLSTASHIDALPGMSIDYSDEVSATHSMATSPIDKEVLFYLTSRGIDEKDAKRLFVASFISRYISEISDPSVREVASAIMLRRIEGGAFGVIEDLITKGIWFDNNGGMTT